ncbi:MAG: hypothetical protein APF77_04415 [Clostridia bacterium BRH_c25]|nr:MAG: hypothetical protein APF77_04415 [Clostridia bacterium BRH_c25]
MKKIKNFAEMAYILGIFTLALGVTLMEKANLGISMVVAPAYLVSLKFNFLTFGMAEYILQAVLLIVIFLLMRKFKLSFGIPMFFHTYLAPEVYELFVKEISKKSRVNITKFKIGYDCASFAVAIIMSLVFFNDIRGVGIGTVLCAVINGHIIGLFSRFFEKYIDFSPKLTIVNYFK